MEEGDEKTDVEASPEETACRLCDEIQDKMYDVYDTDEDGKEIVELIKECLPIIIFKEDPLSKQICQSCLDNLTNLSSFKKICQETQDRHKGKFRSENGSNGNSGDDGMFLGFENNAPEVEEDFKDVSTSTDDIAIFCTNCKQAVLDASTVNGELELSRTDLYRAVAESLRKNRLANESESEKVLRKRKIQPLYQELDDSLCSSLTEFTQHTDNSQFGFDDMASDMDSGESDTEVPKRIKRRKIAETSTVENSIAENSNVDDSVIENSTMADDSIMEKTDMNETNDMLNCTEGENMAIENEDKEVEEEKEDIEEEIENEEENEKIVAHMAEVFKEEPEYIYQPLSLLQLVLNEINMQNIPDYAPLHYIEESTRCMCKCGEEFQNVKLLALHERTHIDVEIEEKVDDENTWTERQPDFEIKKKWLELIEEKKKGGNKENGEDATNNNEDKSLLIPKENQAKFEGKPDEIILVGNKAMVNGIALADYSKEERKAFYQSMRIGGQTKKFCTLCRYCFKDNWAIESHYFSSACFYTCRYCGIRFNKQRHKFDDHIKEHEEKKDIKSDKIYAASKVNNFLPKVIQPQKVRPILPNQPEPQYQQQQQQQIKVRNFSDNRQMPGYIQIKQEPGEGHGQLVTSQSKTGNQAYFCRKCYKVFFKLDEFNIHNKNCDHNQYTSTNRHVLLQIPPNPKASAAPSPLKMQLQAGTHHQNSSDNRSGRNGELNSMGRPIRSCTKDIGPYKDEVYIPESLLKDTVPVNSPQSFICHICNTPFPTIYSRNSHMRIHKAENMLPPSSAPQGGKPRPLPVQSYSSYAFGSMMIKQEPLDTSMEPMVEIHEEEQPPPQPTISSILGNGAVSLTPINKKPAPPPPPAPSINSKIMELVQNNPNITIQKRHSNNQPAPERQQHHQQHHQSQQQHHYSNNHHGNMPNNMTMHHQQNHGMPGPSYSGIHGGAVLSQQTGEDKSYKCSSCWEAFANKSHLYFHKKNQCEGSRYPCPFCKKRFGTEAAYSSHIFYSHPE